MHKKEISLVPRSHEWNRLWMEEELGQAGPLVMSSYDPALESHSSSREKSSKGTDRGGITVFCGACHLNGLMTRGDTDRSG